MSSFRAIERDEKAADHRSVDRACKAKKRALETEEEVFEPRGWQQVKSRTLHIEIS